MTFAFSIVLLLDILEMCFKKEIKIYCKNAKLMMNFRLGKKIHFTNKNSRYSIEDIYEFEQKNALD